MLTFKIIRDSLILSGNYADIIYTLKNFVE